MIRLHAFLCDAAQWLQSCGMTWDLWVLSEKTAPSALVSQVGSLHHAGRIFSETFSASTPGWANRDGLLCKTALPAFPKHAASS